MGYLRDYGNKVKQRQFFVNRYFSKMQDGLIQGTGGLCLGDLKVFIGLLRKRGNCQHAKPSNRQRSVSV